MALTTVRVSATDGKHCGRVLAAQAGAAGLTVCCKCFQACHHFTQINILKKHLFSIISANVTPFTLGVFFDGSEVATADAIDMAELAEASKAADDNILGTAGFQLGFTTIGCS